MAVRCLKYESVEATGTSKLLHITYALWRPELIVHPFTPDVATVGRKEEHHILCDHNLRGIQNHSCPGNKQKLAKSSPLVAS